MNSQTARVCSDRTRLAAVISIGAHLLVAISVGFLFGACSRSEDVSGAVFVTMKSGDVKRGADVQIVLVPATDAFSAQWQQTAKQFAAEHAEADAAYQEARRKRDVAFQQTLEDIRNGWSRSSSDATSNASLEAARRVDEISNRYQAAARQLIKNAGAASTTRTDVNGAFTFKAVPQGKYFLFAEHEVFDNHLYWMVPIEVNAKSQKFDLSNSNSGWPFSL